MSHFVRYGLAAVLLSISAINAENISSRSSLTAQPFSLVPTDMTHSLVMDQYCEDGSVLNRPEFVWSVFGGASTNPDAIARYFLFNNKTVLLENEVQSNDVGMQQDIIGWNFNISTLDANQSSLIALNPKQTYYGVGLAMRYSLSERCWMTTQVPFLSVTNDLGLTERINTQPGALAGGLGFDGKYSQVGSMIEAFRHPDMLYGKIDGPRTKRGFGDTTITLGYDLEDRSERYFAPFIGATIPTSNKPTAEYMWEPVLGNNKHAGAFVGAYGHSQVYEKNSSIVWFTWSIKTEYLFANTQKRSFDLHRGPWTRYLAMYKNNEDRTSSVATIVCQGKKTYGINLMTQDVDVSPGFSNSSTLSLSFTKDSLQGTLGTSSFIRESEDVVLTRPWQQGPAVADLVTNNSSNTVRNISTMIFNDGDVAQQLYITEADINFGSGASSTVLVGSLFATLGYSVATEHPQIYEIGASYDASKQNNAVNRFALWGRFQITF